MRRPAPLVAAIFFLVVGAGAVLPPGEVFPQTRPLWREGPREGGDPELTRLSDALARLAEKVQLSVVHIRTNLDAMSTPEDQSQRPRTKRGSGFMIGSQGYIITANHVIEGAAEVEILFTDRQRLGAQFVAADSRVDLAVLKVEGSKQYPDLPLGDSDSLKVGELVMAVGYPNPTGPEGTLSLGIVGWRGRSQTNSMGFEFIQTDAGASPGVSGGPLVNMKGHVVGMITRASPRGHIGFAVPINVIKQMVPRLVEKEKVAWGWLGVRVSEMTGTLAETVGLSPARGVQVSSVITGQPAEGAGVISQDVILAVDGVQVDSPREFSRIIGGSEAGKQIDLTIFRKGETLHLPVRLGSRPNPQEPQ